MYFSRGNHETRGAYAREAARYRANPGGNWYYAFRSGPAVFVVLDSGEDKPDGHIEYSGLASFEAYRQQQSIWLRDIVSTDMVKSAPVKIAVTHIPLNFHENQPADSPLKQYQDEWTAILDKAGFSAAFSGHTHKAEVVPPAQGRGFPIVTGGGQAWSDTGNFAIIRGDVTASGIQVRFVAPDGRELHTEKIRAREK